MNLFKRQFPKALNKILQNLRVYVSISILFFDKVLFLKKTLLVVIVLFSYTPTSHTSSNNWLRKGCRKTKYKAKVLNSVKQLESFGSLWLFVVMPENSVAEKRKEEPQDF